jgi:hypothetical protein
MPANATEPENVTAAPAPPVNAPKHPLSEMTTYELRDYRRQLERAIAFFAAQDPVPAVRDELQAKLDAVTAEQGARSRLAGG